MRFTPWRAKLAADGELSPALLPGRGPFALHEVAAGHLFQGDARVIPRIDELLRRGRPRALAQ